MAHFTRLIIGLTLAAHIVLALPAAAANMTPGTSAAFTPRSSEMPPRPPIVEKDTISRFTFAVTSDMQDASGPGDRDTPSYFRGAVEAIAATGPTAFMVVPGDLAPPDEVEWTIERYLGESYLWYPVMGNHDIERKERLLWFQTYNYDPNGDIPPNIVRSGPLGCEKTTYSFDYNNAHFVVLDEFCNEANGTISNQMYNWLYADLEATTKQHIFVFGHEPAYPQPDADNGVKRHMNDSLDKDALKRDLFWELLQEHNVVAYFCGHTHTYSAVNVDGVWQITAGHSQGLGYTGTRSTFLRVDVNEERVTFEAYRDDANGGPYTKLHEGVLVTPQTAVSLAVVPGDDVAQTVIAAEQLAAQLQEEVGYNVHAFLTGCEAGLVNDLAGGHIDAGWLSPLSYVQAYSRAGIQGPLHAVSEPNGSRRSQFLIRQGSGMATLNELQGKNFVFVDPSSVSGYLYPAAYIVQTQGITPSNFFNQTFFAGSPAAVAEAIYTGEFEGTPIHGGAVYADAREELLAAYPDILTQTEVLTYTPFIPGTTVSLQPSLNPLVSQNVISGLLSLADTPEGQTALTQIQGAPKLEPITNADYALTRDIATARDAQELSCVESAAAAGGATSTAAFTSTPGFTLTLTWPNDTPDAMLLYTPIPAITYRPGGSREVGLSFALRMLIGETSQITQTLPTPYMLTVQYDDLTVSPTLEEALGLYYWDGNHWQQETTAMLDLEQNSLTVTLDHSAFQWTLLAQRQIFLPALLRGWRP